jgi:hypothetical protein
LHPITLTLAQLGIVPAYGFASWERLKAEVERKRLETAPAASDFVIRPVASIDELASVFDFVFAQMTPGITHEDRRYHDLAGRFE